MPIKIMKQRCGSNLFKRGQNNRKELIMSRYLVFIYY